MVLYKKVLTKLTNKNISITGNPINIKKNEFICLIQNYIINVYLSNYEQ